ncbi:hypothetical protein GCM10027347_60470 [Larkinella harenae]
MILQKALKQVNPQLNPVLARNQNEVISFFQTEQQNHSSYPQLVLMDLYLPRRRDGWAILETIQRLMAQAKQVPVIILTSSTDLEDVIDAYQEGVRSYLIKPKTFSEWLTCCKILSDYLQAHSHPSWKGL